MFGRFVILILLLSGGFSSEVGAETLVFSSGHKHSMNSATLRVLEKAYRKLDISIELDKVPVARSIHIADAGVVDGELFRGKELGADHGNLIRIPVELFSGELTVFTKNYDIDIAGWDSLRGYRVGSHLGVKEIEAQSGDVDTIFGTRPESLFEMLKRGRLDFVILPRHVGLAILSEIKLTEIKVLSPALECYGLYHYLHNKHLDLVEPITTILQQMVDSGEVKAIYDNLAEPISQSN